MIIYADFMCEMWEVLKTTAAAAEEAETDSLMGRRGVCVMRNAFNKGENCLAIGKAARYCYII